MYKGHHKDLPHSTGNSAQGDVAAWMGGESGGEWRHTILIISSKKICKWPVSTWKNLQSFPGGSVVRSHHHSCQGRSLRSHGLDRWVGKIPLRRKWHPTSVFLPRKSHGQRSLAGYSPWDCKDPLNSLSTNTLLLKCSVHLRYTPNSSQRWECLLDLKD